MLLSSRYAYLYPIEKIRINRDDRQRRELKDIEEMADSIRERGVLQPIIVRAEGEDLVLVAGERRLEGSRLAGLVEVPIRLFDNLSAAEAAIVELEENIKRRDLDWRDVARAVKKLHETYSSSEDDWTAARTASRLGVSPSYVSQNIQVASQLDSEKSRVSAAPTFRAARNIVARDVDRAVDEAIASFGVEEEPEAPPMEKKEPPKVVINTSFIEWVKEYSGPKFNLIHCDFPYGIGHDKTAQGGAAARGSYSDTPEVYRTLLNCLCENQHKFISSSAHMIFWFSMNYYSETKERLEKAGWFVVPHPLIWSKSDNKGIVSDVLRRPRHIYETAFFCSFGDRKIISPVSDEYSCPTGKSGAQHISEKPVEMLTHFFRLCCDESSTMLDPTCGAGSALRAAHSAGAKRVLGLEIEEEYAEIAQRSFTIATMSDISQLELEL